LSQGPAYADVEGAIARLLSYPAYTSIDEKILNRAGDLAALVVTRTVSLKEMDSPGKSEQIFLILHMAFAAPQLIVPPENRNPSISMLLLDHLDHVERLRGSNGVENIRFEIQHNSSTGKSLVPVTLEGVPPVDEEHSQWVGSVLRWTRAIQPGRTRRDLLKVFTMDGGIYSRSRQTFVLKGCDSIHVDVKFAFASDEQGRFTETPDDKIVTISKPYLDYFHAD
jgi:hypothetical protein